MCENLYVLERATGDRLREARERAATRRLLLGASRASGAREQSARELRSDRSGSGQAIRQWLRSLARITSANPRGADGSLGAAASRSR